MKIKRTSKALNQLSKYLDIDKEELAIKCYQMYIGLPDSENEDKGMFLDYLEENHIYEMAENIVNDFFGRYPICDELHIIAGYLEKIEMI